MAPSVSETDRCHGSASSDQKTPGARDSIVNLALNCASTNFCVNFISLTK